MLEDNLFEDEIFDGELGQSIKGSIKGTGIDLLF